jgi:membrane dipeptidase
MEGADPIRQPEEVELWYERGLRIIGLSWDDTRYSPGAWREGGGLTKDGWALLETAADYNFILDLTHMSDEASLQVLDNYEGPIIASHSNARALVPSKRQLNDTQINRIAERNGVIGIAFANPFLKAGLSLTDPKESVTIEHVLAHIDHICQNVGNADHVGIGTDFDGGFGVESVPAEIETPSDFHLLTKALQEYGYDEDAVTKIMGGNWLRLLGRAFDQ